MSDALLEVAMWLKSSWWVAWTVGGAIVLIEVTIRFANFTDSLRKLRAFVRDVIAWFKKQSMNDEELAKKAKETAVALLDLTEKRQSNEPRIDVDNFHASADALSKYSMTTVHLYERNLLPDVMRLRDEFRKRRLSDSELDAMYERPTNYIGLRMIATSLVKLSMRLPRIA